MRGLSRAVFKLQGWKVEGTFPNEQKFIIAGAPHTSNWDALYMIATGFLLKSEFRWMVKSTVIESALGPLALWGGALPIERSHRDQQVQNTIDQINQMDDVILIISPEGSRSKGQRWKTGFYHIAVGAKIPVVPCYLNYAQKTIGIGEPVYPTGDIDKDMETFSSLYKAEWAKFPEKFTPPVQKGITTETPSKES